MKKTINTPKQFDKQDLTDRTELEGLYLDWFEALFTTIKSDIDSDNPDKARKLADIGQYLAQDKADDCEQMLEKLQNKGV